MRLGTGGVDRARFLIAVIRMRSTSMTRTVGRRDRSELIPDPAEALRRGRVLDAMLASTRIPRPRGVLRATHRQMNQQDDARQLEAARRLNTAR